MVIAANHHPIGILPADIDHMGHVNNSVYLKWVQEAVVLDDNVVADIIADRIEGAKAFSGAVIKRGDQIVAEVTSSWCCLDAVSKRPARLARD